MAEVPKNSLNHKGLHSNEETERKVLTAEQKEQNKQFSTERIGVEHCIGGVKVFGIMRGIYHNMCNVFGNLAMETACGLHNLRLDHPLSA